MAFKITCADQRRIEALIEKFDNKKSLVEEALTQLNEVRDELRGVVEDIKDEMQSQYDDKSEKWLEGDRASPTEDWISDLEEVVSCLEDEIEMPDTADIDSMLEEGVPCEPEY